MLKKQKGDVLLTSSNINKLKKLGYHPKYNVDLGIKNLLNGSKLIINEKMDNLINIEWYKKPKIEVNSKKYHK